MNREKVLEIQRDAIDGKKVSPLDIQSLCYLALELLDQQPLRERAAIAAMQAILPHAVNRWSIGELAVKYADELVKELKK